MAVTQINGSGGSPPIGVQEMQLTSGGGSSGQFNRDTVTMTDRLAAVQPAPTAPLVGHGRLELAVSDTLAWAKWLIPSSAISGTTNGIDTNRISEDRDKFVQIANGIIAEGMEKFVEDLRPTSRYHLACEILTALGLNPERPIANPQLVDSNNTAAQSLPNQAVRTQPDQAARSQTEPGPRNPETGATIRRPVKPAAQNPAEPAAPDRPLTAADYYVRHDTLTAQDLQRMSDRELSPEDIQGMLAKLPASLETEFGNRFDVYATDISMRLTRFIQIWIALVACRNGIRNMSSAEITLSRATLHHDARQAADRDPPKVGDPNPRDLADRNSTVLPSATPQRGTPGDGYFVSIRTADSEYRYFLCTTETSTESIPPNESLDTWIQNHEEAVFSIPRTPDPLRQEAGATESRVVVHPMGSGTLVNMEQWLTPSIRELVDEMQSAL